MTNISAYYITVTILKYINIFNSHDFRVLCPFYFLFIYLFIHSFIYKDFVYLFLERGEGRERGRETSV